jgi:hypothetical protein
MLTSVSGVLVKEVKAKKKKNCIENNIFYSLKTLINTNTTFLYLVSLTSGVLVSIFLFFNVNCLVTLFFNGKYVIINNRFLQKTNRGREKRNYKIKIAHISRILMNKTKTAPPKLFSH